MDLLNKMASYIKVVDSGSFAAAAKQLRVSPAAVSRQIAALEGELRVSLLARSTRKMTVTAEGRAYYERCVRILREVSDAQTIGREDELGGHLRITAPVTFGLACVAPEMSALLKKHPGLVIDLVLEDRIVDLTPEGFDIAIRVGVEPPMSTELVAHKLAAYQRVLVASPQYLRRRGAPKRPEALAQHETLMHLLGQTDTWTLRRGELTARVRPKVAFRTNALHALREMAIDGAGIALLPAWLVGDALESGRLKAVLPGWRSFDVPVLAIHRRELRGSARVKSIVDHLRRAFGRLNP